MDDDWGYPYDSGKPHVPISAKKLPILIPGRKEKDGEEEDEEERRERKRKARDFGSRWQPMGLEVTRLCQAKEAKEAAANVGSEKGLQIGGFP